MVLLDKLWDDVLAGPHPDRGLEVLRKVSAKPLALNIRDGEGAEGSKRSISMPASPGTPATPTTPVTPTTPAHSNNVWRSVFNPGSNLATRSLGAHVFDKPEPNSPTVYDWLYSGESRSKHR